MSRTRIVGFAVGVAGFLLALVLPLGLEPRAARALAVLVLMMAWWFTEALPIYATALAPLALYPPLGVLSLQGAALPYVDGFVFLFLGGMVIAAAMERTGLHRRIALRVMRAVGTDPKRLLLGFMIATAFVSLWISNTATATMMFPIGMAVIAELEARTGRRLVHYGCAVMLSIAYAANIGGMGTLIGTAPNAQFASIAQARLGVTVGFAPFLWIGLPAVGMLLPLGWLALWRVGRREGLEASSGAAAVDAQLSAMGRMSRGEKTVLAVFVCAAILWILSQPIAGAIGKPASRLLGLKFGSKEFEWSVAVAAGIVLLSTRLADGPHLRKISWETLLLIGGGLAMAAGIEQGGLGAWAGGQLRGLGSLPPPAQVGLASFAAVFISAFASNTATVAILLPLLAGVLGRDALPALAAASLGASCDFMLPAGTPPNAIVFGSGYVTVPRMMRVGAVLDLVSAVVVALWAIVAVRMLFGPS